jgi:two-component system, LytTR family, sensor kinase
MTHKWLRAPNRMLSLHPSSWLPFAAYQTPLAASCSSMNDDVERPALPSLMSLARQFHTDMANPEKTTLPVRRRLGLLITAACLVPAALGGLQQYMQGRISGHGSQWQQVVFQAAEWLFLGALTPIVYLLGKRFPLSPNRWKLAVLIHVGGALLLCFGWASLGILLGTLLDIFPAGGPLRESFPRWLLISLPNSVFLYFTELGCIYAVAYFVEARKREAQASRLATQLAEARLGALRMQLNPHFLFNSLNALAVLVREKRTEDASRMLELLSDVLRRALRADEEQLVPLDAELEFLKQYLAIEEVRFSDRLRIQWSIDARTRRAQVPTFILQPIVENAIRHGIAKRADSGLIRVSASIVGDQMLLVVEDDGSGMRNTDENVEGVGLSNTRKRLEALFGNAGRLTISSKVGHGTRVAIYMPYAQEGVS